VIQKELAEGQLYPMQELTIRQQEKARPRVTTNARDYHQTTREGQTTRENSDKYTDTTPSVIKKELAEGQLYPMQELTFWQQEKARPQRRLRQVHRRHTKCD